MDGIETKWLQLMYDVMKLFYPLLMKSSSVITSEHFGKAMIQVAKNGYSHSIVESHELKQI
ncbi:hypothetical protein M3226_26740 [Neobacillus cucumis]|uniref:hypothetical protein n=1 Tax=Neobacillus cucumis TaxID=1740721 RepID=UPI00203C7C65|nr:hypothetical protein [Neobacillus cucumis]MCM3729208.1 hypothetical protein [Neobacillus cucumis]